MGQKYLLPCACGQKQIIDRTDAGQTVRCGCGRPLDVPTFTQIALLEPLATPPADTARAAAPVGSRWGLRQQMLTGGIVLALGGAVIAGLIAGYFYLFAPARVPVETMPPLNALLLWDSLEMGIAGDPTDHTTELLLMVDRDYHRRMLIAAVVGAVGVLVFLGGLLVPRKPAAKTSPAPRAT